jgi:hypothetical protein
VTATAARNPTSPPAEPGTAAVVPAGSGRSADRGPAAPKAGVRRDGPAASPHLIEQPTGETGGPKGPEPTRYGDWEKGGRCFDF